ncbi:MAG TPA: hypothetical protein VFZ53_30625 [Polyangiaceae bacterium]
MKRLLEGDGSEVERGLLDALRLERPSPELEQRMRAAIGLGPIGTAVVPEPSSPTAAAVPTGKTLGFGAVAAGAVAAAVVAGSVFFLTQGGSSDGAAAPVAPAPVNVVPPAAPQGSPSTPADLHVDELPQEQAAPKARQQVHAAPTSASLKEEIRLIDSARVAVKNNEGARAVGILDQYARRFPDGAFKEEARVLRAEARKSR